jgi:glyoxylase-like metal-dependent hydrolase (beta-lactamase superfamily II)
MCFLVEGSPVVLTGDTLFPGGPGNTQSDLGDFPLILSSIDRRLFAPLPDETLVLPGHGADTTIGRERPHFDEWVQRGW